MAERVLVTGANGMIGAAVVRTLLKEGYAVRAFVRSPVEIPGVETIVGDMRNSEAVERAVRGVHWVIHLAACKNDERESEAVNVGGAQHLVDACNKNPVRCVINVSTQSVKLSRHGTYARTKAAADAVFARSGLPVITVLPSVVYGDINEGIVGSLLAFLQLPIVPVIGSGNATFRPIQKDDLARGLLALSSAPDAIGKTYDAGGPDAVSFIELVRMLQEHTGQRKPVLHIPAPVAMAIAVVTSSLARPPITRSNVLGADECLNIDVQPFFKQIGFVPRSLHTGLKELLGKPEEREAKALLHYVMNNAAWTPDPYSVDVYLRACRVHEINPLHRMQARVLRSKLLLGGLDAVTRLLKPQCMLQRKLLIAAAVTECHTASAQQLLPRDRSVPAVCMLVMWAGVKSAFKLAFGILLLLSPTFFRRNAGL